MEGCKDARIMMLTAVFSKCRKCARLITTAVDIRRLSLAAPSAMHEPKCQIYSHVATICSSISLLLHLCFTYSCCCRLRRLRFTLYTTAIAHVSAAAMTYSGSGYWFGRATLETFRLGAKHKATTARTTPIPREPYTLASTPSSGSSGVGMALTPATTAPAFLSTLSPRSTERWDLMLPHAREND